MKRGGAALAREAHDLEVAGSTPAPATSLAAAVFAHDVAVVFLIFVLMRWLP